MLDLQYIFNAAYHKASQSNQSWQETVCSSAEGNGEVSTVSDLGWYSLPPCQLGATQRLGKYTMHGNTTCSICTCYVEMKCFDCKGERTYQWLKLTKWISTETPDPPEYK